VLSTHTLFGTLLEGIFGYQETPSVSEVAVYLLYLIPALVLFALPPRIIPLPRGLPDRALRAYKRHSTYRKG
jgi:high-affinity Fe2+/Pb2+ permease